MLATDQRDIDAFGRNAAVVLGQLDFWLNKSKTRRYYLQRWHGELWVAKPRADLMRETRLSRDQVARAVSRLIQAGVLLSEPHLINGKTVPHYRVIQAQREGFWVGHCVNPLVHECVNDGYSTGASTGCSTHATTLYSSSKRENKKERKKIASETQSGFEESEKKGSGKEEKKEGKMARPKSLVGGYSVKDLKEKAAGRMQAQSASVSVSDASTPGQLSLVWKHAWADTFEEYGGDLTAKQAKQLKMVADKCPRGGGGQVIDYAVRNWPVFEAVAITRQGAFKTPALPDPSFLLRFVQSAIQCWQEAGGEEATKPAAPKPAKAWKVPPKPEPAAPVAKKPEDEIVTDLDLAAKLLGLDG